LAKFDTADQAWRNATLSSEETGDHSIEDAALKVKETVKKDLARLQAALEQAEARDASDAIATQKAREASEDAGAILAFEDLAKVAKTAAPAIAAYATAYANLEDAAQNALAKATSRVRRDLLSSQSLHKLVSEELARLSTRRTPGAEQWIAATRDPTSLTPLAEQFGALAAVIKEELHHV
jgi:hypothetical protein